MEQKATEERNNCLLTHLPGVLAVLRMTLPGPWQMAPGPMCQEEPDTEGNESDMEMEAWEAAFPGMEVLSSGLHADGDQGNPRRDETIGPPLLCG